MRSATIARRPSLRANTAPGFRNSAGATPVWVAGPWPTHGSPTTQYQSRATRKAARSQAREKSGALPPLLRTQLEGWYKG
eukprot:scaffold4990_cov387-Prasinococcus_capsulatus_cf.AAC.11